MSRKYLRENKNSFNIVKSSKIYAKITAFEDATFIRDLLVDNDWDLDATPNYSTRDEAESVKKEMEETYNTEYVIWEVD